MPRTVATMTATKIPMKVSWSVIGNASATMPVILTPVKEVPRSPWIRPRRYSQNRLRRGSLRWWATRYCSRASGVADSPSARRAGSAEENDMTTKTSSVTPSTMTGSATRRRPIRRMRLDTEMLLCVSVLPPEVAAGWRGSRRANCHANCLMSDVRLQVRCFHLGRIDATSTARAVRHPLATAAPPAHEPQDLDDPVPTKDRPVSAMGLKFSNVVES